MGTSCVCGLFCSDAFCNTKAIIYDLIEVEFSKEKYGGGLPFETNLIQKGDSTRQK